jgi:rRNA-processing protein FCF1
VLITPLPGSSRQNLLATLAQLRQGLVNLRGGGGDPQDRAFAYIDWMHEARRQLLSQVRTDDLERVVPPRSYDVVIAVSAAFGGPGGARVLNGLLSSELTERLQGLEDARNDLEQHIAKLTRPGVLVVLDTNVYLHHPNKLEEIDLRPALRLRAEPVHILVPMVVVDELDGLKRQHKNRWRAGYTTAVFDRVVQQGGMLRDEDFSTLAEGGIPRGRITLDILFDPPGHVRLPINDDEIVDRAASVEPLTDRKVRLVTYDTGMAMRGRAAGLQVIKLEQPEAVE